MIQYVITAIILLAAVAYAVCCIKHRLQNDGDCCCGCSGCKQNSMNKQCCEKKF